MKTSSPNQPIDLDFQLLRSRPLTEYSANVGKADCGDLLIVAGSRRLPGAAILCARAALRSGCGSVRIALPESIAISVGCALPESMVIPLPETRNGTISLEASTQLAEQAKVCDAAVIGPGCDDDEETAELLRRLAAELPLSSVLSGAALLALAESKPSFAYARILLPQLHEMSALLGEKPKKIDEDCENLTAQAAKQFKSTVVLQSNETLVASPGGPIWKNNTSTRGLLCAASGDVLAGIVGSLLAQFSKQETAEATEYSALWGAHLHALCGEAAEKDFGDDGMTASDLVTRLAGVLRYARKQTQRKENTHTGLRPGNIA